MQSLFQSDIGRFQLTPSTQGFFLKEEAYLEPLINKWYAWPYLVPPVTRAMNMAGRNIRLMKSFVQDHKLHISATQDAKLSGGDFVSCSESQVDAVRGLISELETDYRVYFNVRSAISQLQVQLNECNGKSFVDLYREMPAILDGYIELTYDMNHNASIRLLESLLYASPLNVDAAQSISLGLLSDKGERPFVLSSPRVPDLEHIHVDVTFNDAIVDELFAMRIKCAERDKIDAIFSGRRCQGGLDYKQLFTTNPPAKLHQNVSAGCRVRFLGHAGLLFETSGASILIDPIVSSRGKGFADDVISFAELPEKIDYICITHTHMDHLCVETLLQLRHKTGNVLVPKSSGGNIADPSIKLMLRSLGFTVREFDEMEELPIKGGRIVAIPFLGEHADLNIRSKSAWYIELGGKKYLCMADSSCLSQALYRHIHRTIGDIDILMVGMECVGAPMTWLYGSLFTKPVPREINESRRFNGSDFESARQIVDVFRPAEVYVYALGIEPWFKYFMGIHYDAGAEQLREANRLVEYCKGKQIRADLLVSSRTWMH